METKMNNDENDHDEVLDSWEELEDNSVLDKKLKEIKTSSLDDRKPTGAQATVTDSSDRTQYQPQVKILKRQTESASLASGQRSNKPTKTLEQREAEYAEARLRILGAAYGNGDDNEVEEMSEERVRQLFKDFSTSDNCVQVLRQPKGPDGSSGFVLKR